MISVVEKWLHTITGIRSDRVVLGHIPQSPGYLGSVPLLIAKQKAEPSSLQFTQFYLHVSKPYVVAISSQDSHMH